MKECGLEELLEKLKENQIDPETFWTLEDGDFKEMLEVKSWGKRKRLLQRIEEIKKEHEKIMEEKHKESKKVNKKDVQDLLGGSLKVRVEESDYMVN